MPEPLITIGIPAYARPAYLREALQSCLAQDYPNLEILVNDDASPEDPWPAIKDLASPAWTYHRQPKNIGATASFNWLIQRAKGEIVIIHQDDDQLHPQFCRRAAEAFQNHPDAVFYCGQMWRGRSPTGIIGVDISPISAPWLPLDVRDETPQVIPGLDGVLMVLFTLPFMHPALAMRKSVLAQVGGYFSEFMFASDNITFGQMLLHGPALYDPRNSGFFRLHQNNASTGTPIRKQYACRRRAIEILLPLIEEKHPHWPQRLQELLTFLPRRQRWKILAEALEAGYPRMLTEVVARAISPKKPGMALTRTRLTKARWHFLIANAWRKPEKE